MSFAGKVAVADLVALDAYIEKFLSGVSDSFRLDESGAPRQLTDDENENIHATLAVLNEIVTETIIIPVIQMLAKKQTEINLQIKAMAAVKNGKKAVSSSTLATAIAPAVSGIRNLRIPKETASTEIPAAAHTLVARKPVETTDD